MEDAMILFGSVIDLKTPELAGGAFSFRSADVKLTEPLTFVSPIHNNLLPHINLEFAADPPTIAAWARGRISRLFAEQDPAALETQAHIDGQTFRDRLFLHFSFVGITSDRGLPVAFPFICSDYCGEICITTGDIPVRNGDRYRTLVSAMISSFWQLLAQNIGDVCDYTDTTTIFGCSYKFGIRDGRPFSDFSRA